MSVTIAGMLEHSKALAEARMEEIYAREGMNREWWRYYELAKKLTPLVHFAAQTEGLRVSE